MSFLTAPTLAHYLVLGAILFATSVVGSMTRALTGRGIVAK